MSKYQLELVPENTADKTSATAHGWYRIEERERVKAVAPLSIGQKVTVSRMVERAGYNVSPTDMPQDQANREAVEIAAKTAGVDYETAERVIAALDWWPRAQRDQDWIDHKKKASIVGLDPNGEYPPLRWLYWKVRGRWLNNQPSGNVRTL